MKKQILFLTLFVAAILGGMNAYGQVDLTAAPGACLTPVELGACATGAPLTPIAGTPYTYTVNVANLASLPNSGTAAANITWVVTKSQTFIDNTGFVATPDANDGTESIAVIGAAGASHNVSTPVDASGNSSIQITWNAFTVDATNPVFLVAYATDEGGVCSSDNMDVWVIEPIHAFTLDIANLDIDGGAQGANYATCVAPVASAVWNNSQVEFDYGINYQFFQVNAANFVGSWQPSFTVSGNAFTGSRVATAVDWSVDGTGSWNAMTTADNGATWTTTGNVPARDASGAVGTTGECIVVRVTLANNQDETVAAESVTLAVNGTMEDPASPGSYANTNYDDIVNTDCTFAEFEDASTQVLDPRPDVLEVAPAPNSFEPTNRNN
jgi:hypothetical protein